MASRRGDELTPREEAFCVNYLLTKRGAESIRRAGFSPSDAAGYAKIKLKSPRIQARLAELYKAVVPQADDAVAIVGERLAILTQIARHKIEAPITASHVTGAIAEMNKIGGDYAPEKHQVDVTERRATFIFVLPDGTRLAPGSMLPMGEGDGSLNKAP